MKHTRKEMIDFLASHHPEVPASRWSFYSDDMLAMQVELTCRQDEQHLADAIALM